MNKDIFEKLLENKPFAVLILSAIFLAFGAIGGIPWNAPIKNVDSTGRLVFFVVGTILFIVAVVLVLSSSKSKIVKTEIDSSSSYGITIDLPEEKEGGIPVKEVNETHPTLTGKYKEKPEDGTFQLIVYDPYKKRYWPQNIRDLEWNKGEWSGRVNIGTESRIVFAVLAPPSGQALSKYYRDMGDASEQFKGKISEKDFQEFKLLSMYWKPVDGELPKDMIVVGQILLKRKK